MSDNNVLIFTFFKNFACFESSLRISKFIKQDDKAKIDWSDVKKHLKEKDYLFTAEQKNFEIIKSPPKRLRFKDNNHFWDDREIGTHDADLAIDALVRVRNNLFHGSKQFGDSSESERNIRLISEALSILDSIIKRLEIKDIYNDVLSYWN